MKGYLAQSDAIAEAFYKADEESKIAPTAELRKEASIKASKLRKEMEARGRVTQGMIQLWMNRLPPFDDCMGENQENSAF